MFGSARAPTAGIWGVNDERDQALELEHYKATWSSKLEEYKAEQAISLAAGNLLGSFGVLGIKSLFLFNGGAIVAVLAFLGHLWSPEGADRALAISVASTLHWFVWGIVSAFTATALAYGSQVVVFDFRGRSWTRWAAETGRCLCLLSCATSLTLLVVGALEAANTLTEHTHG